MGFVDGASAFDLDAESGAARGWDFLGGAPVPLRRRLREDVAQSLCQRGAPLACAFPLGQGGRGPFERLRQIRTLRDYPGMLVSCEGANAFNRRFHSNHVETGGFAGFQPANAPPELAGLVDPKGWIGVYAVAPFVLLIDRERLNGKPTPRRWSDLADPIYRGDIVFGGWRPEGATRFAAVNTFFLVNMLRRLGLSGLKAALANAATPMHSAQMPRLAGTSASPGGVYVLPWLLAELCPRRALTEVVWPEDGALAYPLWLTVQARRRAELAPLIDLFYGAELAAYLDDNLYPSLSPRGRAQIPRGGFYWVGWDYLRSRHAAADQKAARAAFAEIVACD
jgi:ABC-type Fe3+ transport system substrate-binding protein